MKGKHRDICKILPAFRLSGKQPLRTDYSEFETPTIMRRWVEQARENRRRRR